MSKHTAGPWKFGHLGNDFWISTDASGLTGQLARVVWGMGEDVAEGRENARLIAAAPELLEALHQLVRGRAVTPAGASDGGTYEVRDPTPGAWDAARAAIAKATGAA